LVKTSRRKFLKTGAATGAAAVLGRSVRAFADLPAKDAVVPAISQFDYADVQLLDGPMFDQFNRNHAFFLALDDDRLLKPFRQRAGLPAPGEDMGGWYSFSPDFDPPKNMTGYIPGHTFGQYLSGLARAYAVTGSKPTQEKVHRLVQGFAETVTPKFYEAYCLSAYTFDKTTCGLIDAHQFAADPQALAVLSHATDAVFPFLPEKALTRTEQATRPHPNIAYTWDETYTLPENFYLAYKRGAGDRYRQLASRFLQDRDYFDSLAAGENILPGEHAYSHVNALCSAFHRYLTTGSEKHLRAARNGFEFVLTTQSFATGGWGPDETFRKPGSGDIAASLTKTHASFETPYGAYGHFKVARYLLRSSGDSRYGDSIERVLYNTILGALPIQEDGRTFYYSDYNDSARKFFHEDKWPCCSGTFPQVTADYGISSYFRSARALYVNLYVPSKVTWKHGNSNCVLIQRTQYPLVPETIMELQLDRPETFTVMLRIPSWAGQKTLVAVNGKAVQQGLEAGKFLAVSQTWQNGDRIEVQFDMTTRLEAVAPQHPSTVALMYGPLALFAVGDAPIHTTRAQMLAIHQLSQGSDRWKTNEVEFKPFGSIGREKYRLYHDISD
jgi:DUF1680 family protein